MEPDKPDVWKCKNNHKLRMYSFGMIQSGSLIQDHFDHCYIKVTGDEKQGWHSNKSLCSDGFSLGSLVFLPPQKPTLQIPIW